jgi:hypothetical protein
VVASAAADAHVHLRVSAPPSSGSVTVPLGLVPHSGERRRSGEQSTCLVCPHSAHQGDAGGGGGGGKPQVGPLRRRSLILDLGLGLLFQFDLEIDSFLFPNKIHYLARL